jgi:hypothetical protein
MAAVTQLTPNFLGGVSQLNDDKKLNGQLTECINGYPDPTFGLLKRSGLKFIDRLQDTNGDPFNKAALNNASWFYIDRGANTSYVGAIVGANLYVWRLSDGALCTITDSTGNFNNYLSGTDYHFRSIQDTTIITNRSTTTAMQPAGTAPINSTATLKLLSLIDGDNFSVTIQGETRTVTSQASTVFDDMLIYDSGNINLNHHLVDEIKDLIDDEHGAANAAFNGTWCLEGYKNSLVIKRFYDEDDPPNTPNQVLTDYQAANGTLDVAISSKPAAFTILAKGGTANTSLSVFQTDVVAFADLPVESFHGHTVQILNTNSDQDDYYVEFVAYDEKYGRGYWLETVSPSVSPGLDGDTMPHRLVNTGDTTFTFEEIPWIARKAGDDITSPVPSFIGFPITSTFFYNNRFGVLSQDNIIFSVSNDSYNFFVRSALSQIDSDPIDLNVASIRPVTLSEVLPSPQGLTVFSERQQFQIFTTDGSTLTPGSSVVRAISNYEVDTSIAPVDVGTTMAFVSKVAGYSKLFTMQLRDIQQNPSVVDISKVVLEWLPDTIDSMIVSPQNSVIMLVDRSSSFIYLFRYYNNGQENLFQSWTKWQLPGTIQAAQIINDSVEILSQHEDEYTLGRITLDDVPSGDVVATANSYTGAACLDMATRPVQPVPAVDAVVYDEDNDITKIYVPYTPLTDVVGNMVLTVPTADDGTDAEIDADAGYWATGIARTEIGTGYRYFEVKGNFTDYADGIIVGYPYNLEVVLPKFYFRRDEATTDFTAPLTISRVKFSVGRTGAVKFKLKATGSSQWTDVQHTAVADTYAGDSNPVQTEQQFTVPIHQRNTNFELKVTSDLPYPVSLVSMMWEGNYSPRFYRRT